MPNESHEVALDASFHACLLAIDERVAALTTSLGCRCCGGPVCVANYERKVRGLDEACEAAGRYAIRLSLCCIAEGCRKRVTPPSVRFAGRRVYAAVVFVLGSAAYARMHSVLAACASAGSASMSWLTLTRWARYFRADFVAHPWFVALVSAFMMDIDTAVLPDSWLDAFEGDLRTRLVHLLRAYAPWTTGSLDPETSRALMVR
jgi:hypothetical protein